MNHVKWTPRTSFYRGNYRCRHYRQTKEMQLKDIPGCSGSLQVQFLPTEMNPTQFIYQKKVLIVLSKFIIIIYSINSIQNRGPIIPANQYKLKILLL